MSGAASSLVDAVTGVAPLASCSDCSGAMHIRTGDVMLIASETGLSTALLPPNMNFATCMAAGSVLPFQPKCRSGHPEN